jgi:hypothetical protein
MGVSRSQVTIDTIQYMRANSGIGVHYIDVAVAVHAHKSQVNNALTRIVNKHPEMGIRRLAMGQYIFKPEYQNGEKPVTTPEPVKTYSMYEGIGHTQDGTIIVRDEEGVLYKLSERL